MELNLDGQPLSLTHPGGKKWIFSKGKLSEGTHLLHVDLYIQNTREAKSILNALAGYAEERKLIGIKLNETMDESERHALLARLEEISSIEEGLREQLSKARRKIGPSEEMEIYAQ